MLASWFLLAVVIVDIVVCCFVVCRWLSEPVVPVTMTVSPDSLKLCVVKIVCGSIVVLFVVV